MGSTIGPGEPRSFDRAKRELVTAFVAEHGEAFREVAGQLLDFKGGYLDGDLEWWSPSDVDAVLFSLYPQKVLLDPAAIAGVPPAFAALLRFLGSREPEQAGVHEMLARKVEATASRFVAVMNDEDNWSFGKRMWSAAIAEGVDLADADAMARWVRAFNDRPLAERDRVLGPLPSDRSVRSGAVPGPPPYVVFASEDELRAAAAASVLVRRLVTLVTYVGPGRPVTDRGNLKVADGKELAGLMGVADEVDRTYGEHVFRTRSAADLRGVDYPYRLALAADLLRLEGRKVVPGGHAHRVPDAALELVYAAYVAMLSRIGPTTYHFRDLADGRGWYAEELDTHLAAVLVDLFRVQAPVPVDDLVLDAWDMLEVAFDLDDLDEQRRTWERDLVAWSLRRALDRLVELGVIELFDEVRTPNRYYGEDRSDGAVALTPLGVWAVHRMLAEAGDAPRVGALRNLGAGRLLAQAGDLAEASAIAEIDAWIDARVPADAARELCRALLDTPDETARGLGFRALLRIGPAAAGAVDELADDAALAEFVTVFRVDALLAEPDEMDRGHDPAAWVRLLHTVIELWGPDAAVAVWAEVAAGARGLPAMLEQAWRVRGEATETVLAAIGDRHPDKQTAKAARKALFKHRSAG